MIGPGDRPVGPVSIEALAAFAKRLGFRITPEGSRELARDARRGFDSSARHDRTVREIERHVQGLVRAAEHVRDQGFLLTVLPELAALRWSTEKTAPTLSPERFIEAARPYRERFRRDGVGVFDSPYLPLKPRTRKVAETTRWTAWDVVLDVWTDVFAWGVLVFVAVTVAPGSARPCGSVMRPRITPVVDCTATDAAMSVTTAKTASTTTLRVKPRALSHIQPPVSAVDVPHVY